MIELNGTRTVDSVASALAKGTALRYPPKKPQDSSCTATIADLHGHPTVEALLHILNHDLPSAHFLVRHMQAPPAVEGMLLHGILHRAEGDMNNARAWIGDVQDACEGYEPKKKEEGTKLDEDIAEKVGGGGKGMGSSLVKHVYGEEDPTQLIDDVERFRMMKAGERGDGEEADVEERIRVEAGRVLEWCTAKFGAGEWVDASTAWVRNSAEMAKISSDMVGGGPGYREF